MNLHFFYTYERLYFDNFGNGNCSSPAQAALTAVCGPIAANPGFYREQDTSNTNTVGVSGEWQVSDTLKLKANYTFQRGTILFNEFDGVFVANPTMSFQNVVNYPDINTSMNNLRLISTYKLTEGVDLVGLVGYSYFHSNDWNDTANAVQGGPSPTIAYLTPGYYAPTWSVATAVAALKFKFQSLVAQITHVEPRSQSHCLPPRKRPSENPADHKSSPPRKREPRYLSHLLLGPRFRGGDDLRGWVIAACAPMKEERIPLIWVKTKGKRHRLTSSHTKRGKDHAKLGR